MKPYMVTKFLMKGWHGKIFRDAEGGGAVFIENLL